MDLPRLIAFNSKQNLKYLRYVKEDGEIHGHLQFSSDAVVTPYTKFEVERAQGGAGHAGLVHIRCSYNNKYFVRKSANSNFIVATSDEPEEDRSKWSCTMFEPIYDKHFEAFRFRHVQLGFFLCLSKTANQFLNCLFAKNSNPETDHSDLSTVIDFGGLCILPRFVAFKQGAYLKCFDYHDNLYLQFGAPTITNDLAGHEVFTMNDGSVRIKSTHWAHWRRDPNWIKADSKDATSNDINTLFWPSLVRGTDNVVVLKNLGNNMYCKRLTLDNKENCLNAGIDTITSETKMEVHEYVSSREIYNFQFQLADARIYGKRPHTMASKTAVNNTNEAAKITLGLSYDQVRTSTWNTTLGMKMGFTANVVTKVPFILEGKIETSIEFSGSYTFGETKVKREHVEAKIEVTVPPKSERKVSVVATEAQCDVPFSYTQKDYLQNGEEKITEKYDGIYTGLNYYKFEEVIDEVRSL